MSLDAVHIHSVIFIQQVDVGPMHWDVNPMITSTSSNTIPNPLYENNESLGEGLLVWQRSEAIGFIIWES